MTSLTDYFLVAMPTVTDYAFSGSVVYVTNHDVANGAVGVVVNKPLNRTLKNAFVLHHTGATDKRIYELTNNRSVLTDIAAGDQKDRLFISVGYVAWSDYQMENEIKRNDWVVVKADPGLIFDAPASVRYHEALNLLGIKNPGQVYCGGEVFA